MSLATKTVRGAMWTISGGVIARALGLVGTLVVTRFVTPAEYGEVMIAAVLVLTANQLSTFGLGQYVIAQPDAGREIAFHATAYHVFSGVAVFIALIAVGDLLGPVLDAPNAAAFLPGLVLGALIDRVSFVPERILARDLRFGIVTAGRSAGDLAYSVGSVGLAMAGWGAMAIVAGNVARSVVRGIVFVAAVDRRDWLAPCRLRWEHSKRLFSFGLPLSVAAFAAFASRRWDNFFVSYFFGPGPTGMYNLAYNLADVPATQIGEQIGDVLFPSFSRMDAERRKHALIRSLTLLGLVVFPLAVGLGVVAPTLVAVLFDPRWQPVAPMLLLLSCLSVTRPVGWTIASYLQARQLTRPLMALELFKVAALLGALATIGRISPLWTCVAVGVAFALHTCAGLWTVRRADGIAMARLAGGLVPPLIACVPLVAAVLATRWALADANLLARLIAESAAGAIAYVVGALMLARNSSRELIGHVGQALGRRGRHDAGPQPTPV